MQESMQTITGKVLAIDDEPFDLLLIDRYLSKSGFQVVRANSGAHGLSILERCGADLPEAILLDRMMPEMNGIEFMELLATKPALRNIPIVMQTGLADAEQVAYGIAKGARYYIAKPFTGPVLTSIVSAAVRDGRQMRNLINASTQIAQGCALLCDAHYKLRTLDEARVLAVHLSQFFPQPRRVVSGIVEILVNAVEHGNLGLEYADKSRCLRNGDWDAEIARRLELPEYRDRRVRIELRKMPEKIMLKVSDEGRGFDWRPFLEMQPERAFDLHGRGIAVSRMTSFDAVEYLGCGNEVELTVHGGAENSAAEDAAANLAEMTFNRAA